MKPTNTILSKYGTTVFSIMSQLAIDYNAINLGQGFPDQDGPLDIRQKAAVAMIDGPNQYPPMMGMVELRQAVANANSRFYNLDVDWRTEVMVTSGATEALADCIMGLINPGDEVVLIEPLYDSYLPMVQRAGGIAKLVRIEPPEWKLPKESLAAAFSDRTKLILLNSPHNPAGKVFDLNELNYIADLVKKYDSYAVCDEVYEHLLFDGRKHIPLMTLPDMRERCLRIGSAGKTFSVTGWKIGYITAGAKLLSSVAKNHQFNTFTTPPGLQIAAAYGLCKEDNFFNELSWGLQAKRDRLSKGLNDIGFKTMDSEGTYFLTVDFRPIGFVGTDEDFCHKITTEAGVGAVPVSAFYQDGDVNHFARFCFCKGDRLLDEAVGRLAKYFSS
jgi:aspartate/methionine/tyrosine aminotransferase